MYHVFAFCDSWFDEPIEGFKGSFGGPLYSHAVLPHRHEPRFVNGFGMQVARSFGPAYAAVGTHTGHTAPSGEKHREFFHGHFANHLWCSCSARTQSVS